MFFYQLQLIVNFQKQWIIHYILELQKLEVLFQEVLNHLLDLGTLLLDGIGDTIRISLSDDPVKEIKIGNEILKSLGLRNRGVKIISCPSCARQAFQVIDTVKILEEKLSHIKTPVTLSIIGCVVNGPG